MSTDISTSLFQTLQDARETFLRWESLRVVFNGVLIALTCITVFSQRPDAAWQPEFLGSCAAGAVAANLCFFAGPVAEAYIRWLGFQSRMLTYTLFGAGMLFSVLVNQAACFAYLRGENF